MNVNRLFSSESPASKYSYVLIASLLFLIFWLINGNSSSNHKWESDNYDPLAKHQPQAQAHRRTSLKNHQGKKIGLQIETLLILLQIEEQKNANCRRKCVSKFALIATRWLLVHKCTV